MLWDEKARWAARPDQAPDGGHASSQGRYKQPEMVALTASPKADIYIELYSGTTAVQAGTKWWDIGQSDPHTQGRGTTALGVSAPHRNQARAAVAPALARRQSAG